MATTWFRAACWIGALAIFALAGCEPVEQPPPRVIRPASRELKESAERVVLGDPQLFVGIPGEGALTDDEFARWLEDERNVAMLRAELPWHLQSPGAPAIPPFSRAEVELGRQLFFDKRLSSNVKNFACAHCHHPRDHFAHPGHNRDPNLHHARAVPTVFNRVLGKTQFWDGRSTTLEEQVLQPIFNHDEMGMTSQELVAQLQSIPAYNLGCLRIEGEITERAAARALSAFLRALVSLPTPLDEARRKAGFDWESWVTKIRESDEFAERALPGISPEGRRGARLFYGKANCAACHSGPNFTDESFHVLGLDAGQADPDPGRFTVTHREEDRGAFKTPSLREVDTTRPYMHRGQVPTFQDVVAFYNRGGGESPAKDRLLKPLDLSSEEQADLLAFLRLLTGGLPPVEVGRLPK